jgi:hypothetical protein
MRIWSFVGTVLHMLEHEGIGGKYVDIVVERCRGACWRKDNFWMAMGRADLKDRKQSHTPNPSTHII